MAETGTKNCPALPQEQQQSGPKQFRQRQYIIQTSIINNQNVEVNLEIILKLTTFAGNQVYSLVCKNRNLLIKMDKLE